jgi:NTE family protein
MISMKKTISVQQFIADTKVDNVVDEIRTALISKERVISGKERMPSFSDLISTDEAGNEYQHVNYVQEGGGVLGVGLVGYTYVLEKLGIKFIKLAGTSAGAINTMMLAAVDRKNYAMEEATQGQPFTTQSEIILHELLQYNLWNFVDGSRFGKLLINTAIKASNNFKKVLVGLSVMAAVSIISALLLGAIYIFEWFSNWLSIIKVLKIISIAAFASAFLIVIVSIVAAIYLKKFKDSSFGINPGNAFRKWIADILERNGITTNDELDRKMDDRCCNLQLRPEREAQQIPGDTPKITGPFLTIVASDITNQTKVEFPLMSAEYYKEPGKVNPADYVRASMSIPLFFEPFKLDVTEVLQRKNEDTYMKAFACNQHTVEKKIVQFVDGGILSNFPINVFHNPTIEWARMPTLGVKLEDEKHETENKKPSKPKRSFLPFVGSIFSTIRFYYDRDFLKKNVIYETCIAHVDVEGFNWLDFGLNDVVKKKLFIQGALAARTFFLGSEIGGSFWVDGKEMPFKAFDWETFKQERRRVLMNG